MLKTDPSDGLSFPKNLIAPPKSQVTHYEDEVAQRIQQLDTYASQLGRGFGLPYLPGMQMDEQVTRNFEQTKDNLPLAILVAFGTRFQLVSLERHEGQWGLFYSHTVAPVGLLSGEKSAKVPLKNAPLGIREAFLRRSEEFFRHYLDICKDRLGTMKEAVGTADRTLALLESLRLT